MMSFDTCCSLNMFVRANKRFFSYVFIILLIGSCNDLGSFSSQVEFKLFNRYHVIIVIS